MNSQFLEVHYLLFFFSYPGGFLVYALLGQYIDGRASNSQTEKELQITVCLRYS